MSNSHVSTVRTPGDLLSRQQARFSGFFAQTTKGLFDRIYAWQARAQDRAHLDTLDDRLLKDVGLSRTDVDEEIAKPFWRP